MPGITTHALTRWTLAGLLTALVTIGAAQFVFSLGMGLACSEGGETVVGCYQGATILSIGSRTTNTAPGYDAGHVLQILGWLTDLIGIAVAAFGALRFRRLSRNRRRTLAYLAAAMFAVSAVTAIGGYYILSRAPNRAWCATNGFDDCQPDWN